MLDWTMEEINLAAIFFNRNSTRQSMLDEMRSFDPNKIEDLSILELLNRVVGNLDNMSEKEFESGKDDFLAPAIQLVYEENFDIG